MSVGDAVGGKGVGVAVGGSVRLKVKVGNGERVGVKVSVGDGVRELVGVLDVVAVNAGRGVVVGVRVAKPDGSDVGVSVHVPLGLGVAVAVPVSSGVWLLVGVRLAVGVCVAVRVIEGEVTAGGDGEGVGVAEGIGAGEVGSAVREGVGVADGVGTGEVGSGVGGGGGGVGVATGVWEGEGDRDAVGDCVAELVTVGVEVCSGSGAARTATTAETSATLVAPSPLASMPGQLSPSKRASTTALTSSAATMPSQSASPRITSACTAGHGVRAAASKSMARQHRLPPAELAGCLSVIGEHLWSRRGSGDPDDDLRCWPEISADIAQAHGHEMLAGTEGRGGGDDIAELCGRQRTEGAALVRQAGVRARARGIEGFEAASEIAESVGDQRIGIEARRIDAGDAAAARGRRSGVTDRTAAIAHRASVLDLQVRSIGRRHRLQRLSRQQATETEGALDDDEELA